MEEKKILWKSQSFFSYWHSLSINMMMMMKNFRKEWWLEEKTLEFLTKKNNNKANKKPIFQCYHYYFGCCFRWFFFDFSFWIHNKNSITQVQTTTTTKKSVFVVQRWQPKKEENFNRFKRKIQSNNWNKFVVEILFLSFSLLLVVVFDLFVKKQQQTNRKKNLKINELFDEKFHVCLFAWILSLFGTLRTKFYRTKIKGKKFFIFFPLVVHFPAFVHVPIDNNNNKNGKKFYFQIFYSVIIRQRIFQFVQKNFASSFPWWFIIWWHIVYWILIIQFLFFLSILWSSFGLILLWY